MGRLINGKWYASEEREKSNEDEPFQPEQTPFQNVVKASSNTAFPAEAGRYHLYISRACPWAHRAALVRRLKGLETIISMDIVDPVRIDQGWEFSPEKDGCTPDTVNGFGYLREVYVQSDPAYTGRVTVPVLYDTETETIVNSESADIARTLNQAFDEYATKAVDLYPEGYHDEIDTIIETVHTDINSGVYGAGFATSQAQYEQAVSNLFEALAHWNDILSERRFLAGDSLTLADVFLFPTLFRFDAVYHIHFKCNVKRLVDFTHLWAYARELYQLSAVAPTCSLEHVKEHYYRSHEDINPKGFVPVGPAADWTASHDRDRLGGSLPDELTRHD